MKILSAIGVVIFLVTLGCQENPVNPTQTQPLFKDKPAPEQLIKICCELCDPQNNVCGLNGRANYVFEVIEEAMTPRSTTLISLRINLKARLCKKSGMPNSLWCIEGKSNDIVQVSEDGILLFDKCYFISNRNDIVLLVTYLVTTNGMGIARVQLIPVEQSIIENIALK